MTTTQHTCVVRVNLFLFLDETAQYQEYGSVGCAIIGTLSDPPFYKMGCYNEKNEYVCTSNITTNNETGANLALQDGGYVSFKDEQGKNWSMQFETVDAAIEFCAHASVAMYGASGYSNQSILACDVTSGKRDRIVFANDVVKVRYQSWVVQCESHRKKLPILGSKLDGNLTDEKPFTMTVPANHMGVTPDMKGFEGMIIGMGEEGTRLIVIPLGAKRGGGPQVHMCFYVHIVKKKNSSQVVGNHENLAITLHSSNPQLTENSKTILHNNETSIMQNLERHYSNSSFIPLPGFSREQLLVVDRIRDQVHVLTQELQEARKQLDIFMNDVKIHEQSEKPKSLASAQIEYSIKKLLIDTEEARETLAQKDIALRQIEDKNRELQKKVDKFTNTANLLAEERKNSINLSNEEKLDFDRRITQTQSELTRIQSEREDVARHLSTVKRLLEVADQDLKNEKQKLQVSLIEFQTNESKVAIDEENYTEEISRVKILESKIITLGDQLRSVSEEVRIKESQIDETRKKIENDKLHYTQLLEDERSKAAADIRELRQELIDELATRDRRYQEERQRVIHDSFERGRIQGIEDGQSEALLEADAVTQELTITVQRHKAEVNAMRIRLRSAIEQSEADERRLNSQVVALQETLHNLQVENSQMETENDSLMSAKEELEKEIFQKIKSAIEQLSQPIERNDLLAVIHALRINKKINYDFEVQRAEEREKNIEQEQKEVCEWVIASVGGTYIPFPPMRILYVSEPPVHFETDSNLWNQPELSNELLESRFQDVIESQEALVHFDPDEMDRRYRELLSELTKVRPDIGLLPQKSSSSEHHVISAYEELFQSENGKMFPEKTENKTSLDKTESFLPPEENEQQSFIPTAQEVPYHHSEFVSPHQSDVRESVYPESASVAPENKQEYFPESVPDGDAHFKKEEAKTEWQSDPATFKGSFSNTNSQKQVHQIAPPPRRGVPTRSKRPTLSDSDSDNDFPNLAKEEPKRGVPKRGQPKKSLFDDSDSSDL